MKYGCHLNYSLIMLLVENIIKIAVTTYLGKQVSYRKGTGKLFGLWYN